jgi:hypothetical protein
MQELDLAAEKKAPVLQISNQEALVDVDLDSDVKMECSNKVPAEALFGEENKIFKFCTGNDIVDLGVKPER